MAFWAFVAQALIFLIAALLNINSGKPRENSQPIAIPFGRLIMISVAVLMVAFAGVTTDVLLSPVLCLLSIMLLWFFLRVDSKRPLVRMFPAHPFSIKTTLGSGMTLVIMASIATMSFLVYGTFLLESLFDVTPLVAGYIVALESVSWGVVAVMFSGVGKDKEGVLIRVGCLLVTLGLIGFSLSMSGDSLAWILLWAICQGAGFGMMWSFIVRRIVTAASSAEQDIASSSIPTAQQVGFAIGAAISGIIANMLGFDKNMAAAELQSVAFWIFAAFVPVMLYANYAAWKLSRS